MNNNNHPKPSNSHQDPNLSPTHLLKLAENQLHAHNFSLCYQYALKSQQQLHNFSNDPTYETNKIHANQLVTMSNILNNPKNYYSILQVPTFCNDLTLINSQFDQILSIIDPIKDQYFLGNEALNLVWKAYACLSDPSKKTQFDFECFGQRSENNEGFGDVGSSKFWTFCPYCYYMYEFLKVYEGCCLRCQNEGCKRAFHGAPLNFGEKIELEKGGSFGCFGYFPLGFNHEIGKKFGSWSPIVGFCEVDGKFFNVNGSNNEGFDESDDEIDDESDDESWGGDHGGVKLGARKRKSMSLNARKTRSSARMGNVGVGVNGVEGNGEEYGGDGGGLEADGMAFFEEDGEIFVGLGSDGAM